MKIVALILFVSSGLLLAKADNVMFKDYPFCQELSDSGHNMLFQRYCQSDRQWDVAEICQDLVEINGIAYEDYCLVADPICVYKTSTKLKKDYVCTSDDQDGTLFIYGLTAKWIVDGRESLFHLVDEHRKEWTYNGYDSQMGNLIKIIFSNKQAIMVDHYLYSIESYQFDCVAF